MSHYFEAINDEGITQIDTGMRGVSVSRFITLDVREPKTVTYDKSKGEFICVFRFAIPSNMTFFGVLVIQDSPTQCTFSVIDEDELTKDSPPVYINVAVLCNQLSRAEHGVGLELYNEYGECVYTSLKNNIVAPGHKLSMDIDIRYHVQPTLDHYVSESEYLSNIILYPILGVIPSFGSYYPSLLGAHEYIYPPSYIYELEHFSKKMYFGVVAFYDKNSSGFVYGTNGESQKYALPHLYRTAEGGDPDNPSETHLYEVTDSGEILLPYANDSEYSCAIPEYNFKKEATIEGFTVNIY